jgi:probable HAF family extracellular repeat protein
LGALPGTNTSCAFWISDNGLIAGASENGLIDPLTGWPEIEATFWKNNHLTRLGTLGGNESFPVSVNNRGQVTGFATNTVPDDMFGFGTQVRAFLWERGTMRDLGTLGGPDAFGVVVNNRGQVLGFSLTAIGNGDAFLWENGRMQDIPDTLGGTLVLPFYLNNQGVALGSAGLAGDTALHPFVWYRGVMTDIGTFGGDNGDAVWVNEVGQVVGSADFPGDFVHHALVWQNGRKSDLGTVNGDLCSRAFAVNAPGQIVGTSGDCVSAKSAVLWEGGRALDLNQLVESNSSLTLIRGWNINDRGEIAGEALLDTGDEHAFLLIPHGDCDDSCEQRLAEKVSNKPVPQRLAPAPNLAYKSYSTVSPLERIHSLMQRRYGSSGQRP